MPYPTSPFKEEFNFDVLTELNNDNEKVVCGVFQIENVMRTVKWLCSSPKITSYRINSLKIDKESVLRQIQDQLKLTHGEKVLTPEIHHSVPDAIIIKHVNVNNLHLKPCYKEVIVDNDCAAAILRGAHIYAPGVLGMVTGVQLNDKVSVYVDIKKKCKKGFQKVYDDCNKLFIANGIAKVTRKDLFGENLIPSGIAVEITETISGCPPISNNFLLPEWGLLQNVPSIICVHNLNPKEQEIVLDMCAAPGNKTTHIAAIMQNQGTIIAIDKTLKKIEQLEKNCIKFGAKVKCFQADSTKILTHENISANIDCGPPFLPESFDKILLDAPCSALGKRPQFLNTISEKVVRSYVPLQKKLFKTAVYLLKVGGILVYSTCTITLSENEGVVAWALKNFSCIELIKPNPHLGGPGWQGTPLNEEQRSNVQRFGPEEDKPDLDSVGFFIACFRKTVSVKN